MGVPARQGEGPPSARMESRPCRVLVAEQEMPFLVGCGVERRHERGNFEGVAWLIGSSEALVSRSSILRGGCQLGLPSSTLLPFARPPVYDLTFNRAPRSRYGAGKRASASITSCRRTTKSTTATQQALAHEAM